MYMYRVSLYTCIHAHIYMTVIPVAGCQPVPRDACTFAFTGRRHLVGIYQYYIYTYIHAYIYIRINTHI